MAVNQPSGTSTPVSFEDPVIQVALSVSAKNLSDEDLTSKSDPVCVLYIKEQGGSSFYEVGRTEQIKNSQNPQWIKKFELPYHFEQKQVLKFCIFDWDTQSSNVKKQDDLGSLICSLGEIMSHKNSFMEKPLSKGHGVLSILGEELSGSKEVVTLTLSGADLDKKDFFGKSDPFLVFYRPTPDGSHIAVAETEVIKNNLNPVWKSIAIPVSRLCGKNDQNGIIKISCYDHDSDGSHDLIGSFEATLKQLKETPKSYTLIHPEKQKKKGSSYKGSGHLVVQSLFSQIVYSFVDYLQMGMQIHFTVAVDFTASNGNPTTPRSLHFRQPGMDNQYSLAIKAVGEIIQDYDSDKMFPALGFGARVPPNWEVSHEFFLNGQSDSPYCQGVVGVIDAYHSALQSVQLYGPTNFSPVIHHVARFASTYSDGSNYFVLLILTDGIISDLDETKKALVDASLLPLSVVIVGIGTEDFSKMDLLDSDNKRLCYQGRYAHRDIVQFVEFHRFLGSNHETSKSALAQAVLKEIPKQVVDFMKLRKSSTTSLS